MAGAWPFPALVALAGVVAAGDPPGPGSERVVGALVGVLLCLALGLALAWRHLCRLSPGRYLPRPMGRRALGALRGRWQRLRGRGDAEEPPCQRNGDGGAAAAAPQEEEEELMPWSREQRMEEDEEQKEDEEREEEEEDGEAGAAPQAGESPPSGGRVGGGSAEALLSDLHAFSGTAAWGDTRPHVTAL